MPIKEGDSYLPASKDALGAFDVINQKHFQIGKTLPDILNTDYYKLAEAASDYFTAGVAYLANRGYDDHLQEIGTTMWKMVNQRRVLTALTTDIKAALVKLGAPVETVFSRSIRNDEPNVFFVATDQKRQVVESAFTLLPPHFVYKAKSHPIEALATMTWIGSQIRDLANERLVIDQQYMKARAEASEAHFLHEAVKRHPTISYAPVYFEIMEKYPNGLESLPHHLWYESGFSS